jgi:hypothetical protein
MTPSDIDTEFENLAMLANANHVELATLNERWGTLKAEAASLRFAIKGIEAEIQANTLFDGKNEKIREAQFTLACRKTVAWAEAEEALTGTLIDIESCERDIELRNRSLRAKELQMQFRIEQMQFLNTPRFYREI